MTEWVKCSDMLPPEYDYVLIFCDSKGTGEPKPIGIARQVKNEWDFSSCDFTGYYYDLEWTIYPENITHWMLIPKPPVEL